ncbi:MAG: divergent polysaccharide deacetylase family protein [Spirochaetota bacterium]
MNRGNGSSPKRKKKRQPKRERSLLIGLLVFIAVLLGVMIALLPDSAPPPTIVSEPSVSAADTDGDDEDAGRGDDVGRDEPAAPDIEEYPSPAVEEPLEREVPDDGSPADRPGGEPTTPESTDVDEPWWLPDSPIPAADRGPLVIVLDDAGNSLDGFEEFLRFPGPRAIAVLPQLDYSVQAAAMTASAGKEIMLHLPMEALGGADPGPGAIGPSLTPQEIARRVRENLASVPGAIGVNNHMGSLATADPVVMSVILEELHRRELFFLDSRTSAQTVARAVAERVGIPFAERHVFLDNVRTREEILLALSGALELAQTGDPVIMIGHATVPLLASILNEVFPALDREGYRFVGISELVSPARIGSGE